MTGCALGTDVCHWMFKTKVNMVQGQEDAPLKGVEKNENKMRDKNIPVT